MIDLTAGSGQEADRPFRICPDRLWSLWDMFTRLLLVRFLTQLKFLDEVEEDVDSRLLQLELDRNHGTLPGLERPSPFVTNEDKDYAAKLFIDFREHSDNFGFERTPDRIGRFEKQLKSTNVKLEGYKNQLRTLHEAIEDDARRRFFFYLPIEKTKRYFGRNKAWKAVKDKFRSAIPVIDEAELCLVVEANNSAVYQAMMVLEKELRSLAKELNVSYGVDQWSVVIQNIESEITKQDKILPKGQEKTETLKFFSQAAVEFRHFKDAWRNHVAYARGDYDNHQALSIISHVHDFMTQLSARLSEIEEEDVES
jgi:hypothetical protein